MDVARKLVSARKLLGFFTNPFGLKVLIQGSKGRMESCLEADLNDWPEESWQPRSLMMKTMKKKPGRIHCMCRLTIG